MPVSHIGLTVSHLPTSCSFFLSALQSLGYRFIGQQGNQIGLGIHDADFFLCQETPGIKAGAAHIAFTAPSRTAVRDFYASALNAGGRPNGAPASRTEENGHFNAAVLDMDGNSIEVVFRDGPDVGDDGTVVQHSRVITWQRSVSQSYRDDRSVVSSRTAQPVARSVAPSAVASQAPSMASAASTISRAASIMRSVSAPVAVPQVTHEVTTTTKVSATGDAAKTLIGTLLGAAAGAAVAYAMVRSEDDSAKKEAQFEAYIRAKEAAAQAPSQPRPIMAIQQQQPQLMYEIPRSVHEDNASQYSQQRSVYEQRAIEAPPESYYSPSHISASPTRMTEHRAVEYAPASVYSVAPSRAPTHRSVTNPELSTFSKARSTVSRAPSAAPSAHHSVAPSAVHSLAPSTLISSFVPEHSSRSRHGGSSEISSFVPEHRSRRGSDESIASYHSSKSKAKSHVSKHSSTSKHQSRAGSPPPSTKSRAASVIGSLLGRDSSSGSTASRRKEKEASSSDAELDDFEIEEYNNDTDSVAPSDSISNAGSHRSHRSHRSHHSHRSSSKHNGDAESSVSKHSSSSKHSKSPSTHSSHRRSHHSLRHGEVAGSPLSREWHGPDAMSEPSDASTVKPLKSKSGRKDSVVGAQYDGEASGSVSNLPIRGITPSMIEGGEGAKKPNLGRSMMSFALGQRLRQFEGA